MRSSSSQEEAPASSQGQYRHRRPCCFGVPSQSCDEKCSTRVSTTQRPEPEPRLGLGAAMAEGHESGGRGGAARPTARPPVLLGGPRHPHARPARTTRSSPASGDSLPDSSSLSTDKKRNPISFPASLLRPASGRTGVEGGRGSRTELEKSQDQPRKQGPLPVRG